MILQGFEGVALCHALFHSKVSHHPSNSFSHERKFSPLLEKKGWIFFGQKHHAKGLFSFVYQHLTESN